jgi:antitoxin CptB
MSLETQRMQWRCRRGLLELDIVLERFVSRYYGDLSANQLRIFDDLLNHTDNELLDMIINRTQSPSQEVRELLLLMRSHSTDFTVSGAVA